MKSTSILTLLLLAWLPSSLQADDRPNFLVILVDDMGYSDPGCYGGEIQTPNIDGLAATGLRFAQFYNCARCCPTRATLLTGAYAHRVGLAKNGSTLSSDAPTIAERLKAAGYETAMTGKWHLSRLAETPQGDQRIRWMNHEIVRPEWTFADPATYPVRRGFDRYYGVIWGVADYFDPFSLTEGDQPVERVPDGFYITDAIADRTVQNIHDFAKTDEPFFHYTAFTAPHWPIHARPEDIAKYKGEYDRGWHALRKSRFARQVELGLFPKDIPLGDVIERNEVWADLDADSRAYQAAKLEVHAAMVDRLDQGIGRIVAALRETGQLDNTVIFFLADNGASPEIPGAPGYDRNGATRDGRPALREAELQKAENRARLGSEESYTGIGPAWANAVNTPLRYWKKESFEGGNRTPLIVHWPAGLKVAAGSIERSVGHVMDLAPTCLDLAGVKPSGNFAMDGKSLKPLLQGKGREGHKALFFEHEGGRAVRRDGWKMSALKGQPWELFDIEKDPGETNDLAAKYPERVEAMAAAWQAWYDSMPIPDSDRIKPTSTAGTDEKRPRIANRALTIRCRVTPESKHGVILAQGGNQHGYALHLDEGKVAFSVRVRGQVRSIRAAEPSRAKTFDIVARLAPDATMSLAIDGRIVAQGKAPGLIPSEPIDGLSIGEDSQSNVGNYRDDEERFRGRIENVNIETGQAQE